MAGTIDMKLSGRSPLALGSWSFKKNTQTVKLLDAIDVKQIAIETFLTLKLYKSLKKYDFTDF